MQACSDSKLATEGVKNETQNLHSMCILVETFQKQSWELEKWLKKVMASQVEHSRHTKATHGGGVAQEKFNPHVGKVSQQKSTMNDRFTRAFDKANTAWK